MKLCPKCGTQYPDDANFCPIDAARLAPVAIDRERVGATGAAAAAPGAVKAAAVSESRTPDGRRVLGARFVLGDRIGGRQTGVVYEAVDQSSGQTCVLKVIDAEVFPGSLDMQRTERELGKLARLDWPGIARILDHGRLDGRLWIACERVAGSRSLLDIVFDEGPMPARRAAAILLEVGKALSEAARIGVIHRDLAPKNVLLGGDGAVKLINFGVTVPSTSKVQGVPEFVAPEIVEGKPVDQRANIYSLGALFYYLVAGRPPYMGEPEDVFEQHLSGEPEPPSTHLDDVPEAVDAVILRALARSSSRRFMTLRQLLNDIERIAAGEEPATTSSVMMGTLLSARGKGKSKKLAQTMVGGFQVAQEAARTRQAEAGADAPAGGAGDGQEGAAQAMPGAAAGAAQGRGEAGDIAATVEVAGMIGERDDAQSGLAGTMDTGGAAADGRAAGARADKVSESPAAPAGQARAGGRDAGRSEEGAPVGGAPARASASASGRGRAVEAADERVRDAGAAGDDLSSRALISEMKSGRGKIMAAIVLAIVIAVVLIVYAVTSP